MTNYYRDIAGANLTTDQVATMSNGACDFMRSTRWHRLKTSTVGISELSGLAMSLTPEGTE
jgi:hypothetical protein